MIEIKALNISFCGKRALNIVNSEAKDEVMKFFETHNVKLNQRYANILQSSALNYLSKQPHLISIKTAGTNYFLLLTYLNNTPTTLFIDRKIKSGYKYPRIISSRLGFDESLYHKGTLIDGELVKDKNDNWMLLIHDLIVYDGKRIEWDIVTKYNKLYSILADQFREDPEQDNCPIRVKKLFPYSEYNKMITQFIPRLTYPIRGLYFNTLSKKHSNFLFLYPNQNTMHGGLSRETAIPANESINNHKSNTNGDNSSENTENSVSVFIIRTTDESGIYKLYDVNTGEDMGEAHIPNLKMSKMVRKMLNNSGDEDIKFSCIKNDKFNKWERVKAIES